MPTFFYKAKKGPHEVVEGELDAGDENQAIRALDGLGLVPVAIHPKVVAVSQKAVQKTPPPVGVRRRHVNDFIRNLSNLVKGNVPILKALNLLEKQSPAGMKAIVSDLADAVRQGSSLSQAMERHSSVFPRLLVGMVRSGESGGLLGEMLEKTADHEEKGDDLRRKIRSSLAYPLFVLAMGGVTIFILLVYFMPKLMQTYMSNRQALPWPTEVTLAIGRFLSGNWYWMLGVIVLLFAFARRRGATSEGPWEMVKLRLPFLGSLVLKSSVVSFNRTLGLLVSHGVPLVKAAPLAAETVINRVMGNRLKAVQERLVKHGSSLGAALRDVKDYPSTAVALVVVGEESGNLASALGHIAGQYEKEVETWIKTSTTLIEPLLILLVGGVIGLIVFAMLMPIFQMDVLVE